MSFHPFNRSWAFALGVLIPTANVTIAFAQGAPQPAPSPAPAPAPGGGAAPGGGGGTTVTQVPGPTTIQTFPGGVVHHMAIRLLVNTSNLVIEDIDVEQMTVPRAVCRETVDCLAPIKGLTITKGFTAKVKKMDAARSRRGPRDRIRTRLRE